MYAYWQVLLLAFLFTITLDYTVYINLQFSLITLYSCFKLLTTVWIFVCTKHWFEQKPSMLISFVFIFDLIKRQSCMINT